MYYRDEINVASDSLFFIRNPFISFVPMPCDAAVHPTVNSLCSRCVSSPSALSDGKMQVAQQSQSKVAVGFQGFCRQWAVRGKFACMSARAHDAYNLAFLQPPLGVGVLAE